MLFQAFMTYFLLWNTKEDHLKNGDHKKSQFPSTQCERKLFENISLNVLFGGQNCTINCGWIK